MCKIRSIEIIYICIFYLILTSNTIFHEKFNSPTLFSFRRLSVHFPLLFLNYSLIVLRFLHFSFVRVPQFFPSFWRRRGKNTFTKMPPYRYQSTFFARCSLITPNSQNRLLQSLLSTFFYATDVGFEFPECFNTQLNIFFAYESSPSDQDVLFKEYYLFIMCGFTVSFVIWSLNTRNFERFITWIRYLSGIRS